MLLVRTVGDFSYDYCSHPLARVSTRFVHSFRAEKEILFVDVKNNNRVDFPLYVGSFHARWANVPEDGE